MRRIDLRHSRTWYRRDRGGLARPTTRACHWRHRPTEADRSHLRCTCSWLWGASELSKIEPSSGPDRLCRYRHMVMRSRRVGHLYGHGISRSLAHHAALHGSADVLWTAQLNSAKTLARSDLSLSGNG